MSKFDKNRIDREQKRNRKIDYIRENAFELIKPEKCVTGMIRMNFKGFCRQNLPELQNKTNLNRKELVHLYTTFIAMYLDQEITNFSENRSAEGRRFEEIKTVKIETINRMSKLLKF
jgi:hypothetical protein